MFKKVPTKAIAIFDAVMLGGLIGSYVVYQLASMIGWFSAVL